MEATARSDLPPCGYTIEEATMTEAEGAVEHLAEFLTRATANAS